MAFARLIVTLKDRLSPEFANVANVLGDNGTTVNT
jgi:hypothetical protein